MKLFFPIYFTFLRSNKVSIVSKRIANINEYLTYRITQYCCRGVFEKDKFLFLLLLAIKIDLVKGVIRGGELQAFLTGGASSFQTSSEIKPFKWIPDIAWMNIVKISKINIFNDIISSIKKYEKLWQKWYDSSKPEEETLPEPYNQKFPSFRKLIIIRFIVYYAEF